MASIVEPLERRMLLSLSPAGAEFRANTFTTNAQDMPAIASDADGDFVVVWRGSGTGDGVGVFAQRYNAAGGAQGGEFRVNTTTAPAQADPSVAMDADGDFVVAWESTVQDGSGAGIYAQRFNAAGVRQGGEFRVNTFTSSDQLDPSVAMDASGNFVVTWMSLGQEAANDRGIYAQRYNMLGVPQGGEMHVNSTTANNQRTPSAAMDASGDFIITWNHADLRIYGQRYDAAGAAVGAEFPLTGIANRHALAMDADGDFVLAWDLGDGSGQGVFATRYNAAGVAQGAEFRVNTFTTNSQDDVAVAIDADGDFLITWRSDLQDGSGSGVYAQSFNAAGVTQGGEFRVNTFTTGSQRFPAVTLNADGNAVVAWQSNLQDGSGYGVYAQRYAESNVDTAPPMVGGVFVNGTTVQVAPGQRVGSVVSSLAVSFSEAMSTVGGNLGANSASNKSNYRLTRNGVDVSSQISSASFGFDSTSARFRTTLSLTAPLDDASYVITVRDALRDLAGNGVDGNYDGAAGGEFARAFPVVLPVAVGPNFRVNGTTADSQYLPDIASRDNGDYVVVWQSDLQDGSFHGIYWRRFSAAGSALSAEFRANTFTTNEQRFPVVAMHSDGSFVVAWSGWGPTDPEGIYARRYNANGVAANSEFRVNTFTTEFQGSAAVAMDADGDFVVVWASVVQDGDSTGIYAQRYSSSGAAVGGEFRVNTYTTGFQNEPAVAMDAEGGFVVTWTSDGQPPVGSSGIYAQRYSPAGAPLGEEFRVNSSIGFNQAGSDIAMRRTGEFVVSWFIFNGTRGIRARSFDPSASEVGGDFEVASAFFVDPAVAVDSDGRMVFAWEDDDASTSSGIFARRYSAERAPQGSAFPVNTFTTGRQAEPAVSIDADGDFVIAWQSFEQDGSDYGIYAQRYGRLTEVNISEFLFQTAPHRLQFTFNDNVSSSLGTNDIVLENLTTMQTIPSSDLSLTYDGSTNTATFSYTGNAGGPPGVLADGNYRATLLRAGITNPGGTPLATNHVFNFFFLNGDADHSGQVNLSDFNILAANFGQSPRDFTQGDFTYDDVVNLADFNILAAHFGQSASAVSTSLLRPRDRRHLELTELD